MKQVFFAFALISALVFSVHAQAQPYGIYILNHTGCTVKVTSVKYACPGNCFPNETFINTLPNGLGYPCTTPPQCMFGEETEMSSTQGNWEGQGLPCPDYVPVAFEVEDINGRHWVWDFACGTPQTVAIDLGGGCGTKTAEFNYIPTTGGGVALYLLKVY